MTTSPCKTNCSILPELSSDSFFPQGGEKESLKQKLFTWNLQWPISLRCSKWSTSCNAHLLGCTQYIKPDSDAEEETNPIGHQQWIFPCFHSSKGFSLKYCPISSSLLYLLKNGAKCFTTHHSFSNPGNLQNSDSYANYGTRPLFPLLNVGPVFLWSSMKHIIPIYKPLFVELGPLWARLKPHTERVLHSMRSHRSPSICLLSAPTCRNVTSLRKFAENCIC